MNKNMGRGRFLERVARLIKDDPGRTQMALARAIFGPELLFSRVTDQVRRLVGEGRVRREGSGGAHDPYRYYPVAED